MMAVIGLRCTMLWGCGDTQRPARGHRANEDPRIRREIVHPDPISKERTPRIGRCGVYRDHTDSLSLTQERLRRCRDQTRFSGPGRPRESDPSNGRTLLKSLVQQLLKAGPLVFDDRNRAGQSWDVPGSEPFQKISVKSHRQSLISISDCPAGPPAHGEAGFPTGE